MLLLYGIYLASLKIPVFLKFLIIIITEHCICIFKYILSVYRLNIEACLPRLQPHNKLIKHFKHLLLLFLLWQSSVASDKF